MVFLGIIIIILVIEVINLGAEILYDLFNDFNKRR